MATGDSGCEAYTAIAWGVGLSHERSDSAGAEGFHSPEGNMCGTARRGADALPRSKAPSRAKASQSLPLLRRRGFIALLGGAAVWPIAARAQQSAMPVIGFVRDTPSAPFAHIVNAFRRGLNEVGFVDGQNVRIEQRWAEGHDDRLPALIADLARQKAAVSEPPRRARGKGSCNDYTGRLRHW